MIMTHVIKCTIVLSDTHYRVYKGPTQDHIISGVNGDNRLHLKKSGFPDTGK